MILIGSIFLSVAIVLAFLGVADIYCNISFAFDDLMKIIVIILGVIGIVLFLPIL